MKAGAVLRSISLVTLVICLLFAQSGKAASWMLNGPLNVARFYQTATLLPNGKVLIAGGLTTSAVAVATCELYDPATGICTFTGSLTNARSRHTATLLPNGKVLVTGGQQGFGVLASSELYDPVSGTWTNTGSLNVGRFDHTATLLDNGMVLVAGGGTSTATAAAELYDFTTGQWTSTPPMTTARTMHTATLLTNGLVLVAGGQQGSVLSLTELSSAELYDPVSNIWRATGSMLVEHDAHTAILFPSGNASLAGKVLVAGGLSDGDIVASCELYNPATGIWASTGAMKNPRTGQTATVLPSGDILVTGGQSTTSITNTTETYRTSGTGAGTWALSSAMNTVRMNHTATILPGGKIVVIGGEEPMVIPENSVETFFPGVPSWTPTATTPEHLTGQSATLLANGKVLVAGGYDDSQGGTGSTNADLYDPVTASWEPTGFMNQGRFGHSSTLLQNGDVLVVGGNVDEANDAEVYNTALGTWTYLGPATPFNDFTATLLTNGKVLIAGGETFSNFATIVTGECFLYDPATESFTQTGSLHGPRFAHTATLLPDGQVMVAGGFFNTSQDSCELYNPDAGTWTLGAHPMITARFAHAATLLPDGKVLVAGGEGFDFGTVESSVVITNAELFDPSTEEWQSTSDMNADRSGFSTLLLPNGMVLAEGGETDSRLGGNSAELYDPATGLWTVTASMLLSRSGQSAVLLADGQVFVVGGTEFSSGDIPDTPELFDAGLSINPTRQPQIVSLNNPLGLGGALTVQGSGFRDLSGGSGGNGPGNSPADYPLVQLRSIENGVTTFVPCASWGTNFFVSMPVTNFPAGYALASVFVNGIGSSSAILQISATTTPVVIILTNLVHLPDGSFRFSFTNTPGASSRAFGATNVSIPFGNWTFLGNPTEISSGQFQFDDLQATNLPQRFYRVESP